MILMSASLKYHHRCLVLVNLVLRSCPNTLPVTKTYSSWAWSLGPMDPVASSTMPTATGAAEELHFHGKVFARLHVLRQEDLTSSAGPHSLNLRFCKRKPYGVVW